MRVEGGNVHGGTDVRAADPVAVVHDTENRGNGGGAAGGLQAVRAGVDRGNLHLRRRVGGLPIGDSFHAVQGQEFFVVGGGQDGSAQVVQFAAGNLQAQPVVRGIPQNVVTVSRQAGKLRGVQGVVFPHAVPDFAQAAVYPAHEGRVIFGLTNGGSGQGQAGSSVVLGQQVDNSAGLRFVGQGADTVYQQAAAHTFRPAFTVVVQGLNGSRIVGNKLCRGPESGFKLVQEAGTVVGVRTFAVEDSLYHFVLVDLVHINRQAVAGRVAGFGGVVGDRVFIRAVGAGNSGCIGNFSGGVAPGRSVKRHIGKGASIGANGKNSIVHQLGNRIHNLIPAGTDRGSSNGNIAGQVKRRGDGLAGGLLIDRRYKLASLNNVHVIHLVISPFICCSGYFPGRA